MLREQLCAAPCFRAGYAKNTLEGCFLHATTLIKQSPGLFYRDMAGGTAG